MSVSRCSLPPTLVFEVDACPPFLASALELDTALGRFKTCRNVNCCAFQGLLEYDAPNAAHLDASTKYHLQGTFVPRPCSLTG